MVNTIEKDEEQQEIDFFNSERRQAELVSYRACR
jgi:hypothetical protein